ncbi:META domain-containing protein [Qipengyuania qiaonensis]|uniref:META domain-containing protein n=1 Tax=Qipengyuania qiaonensis TaxID=2867240 RepID=A0ABS7J337_9SPHN|nr:META domain-containing protein [Qipengyuania qiaonensis]MBX7481733.1 META domain-containing protein [Qipengyuania qiaonensis]
MRVFPILLPGLLLFACNQAEAPTPPPTQRATVPDGAPGSTMDKIDPENALNGQWEVVRIDDLAFPAKLGIVNFQSGQFFSHEAGCGGGHPAFYEAGADGSLRTWRREAVRIGKYSSPEAPALERALADFIDSARGWSKPANNRLELTASNGSTAYLRRPVGPVPALEGEWRVVLIDGQAWTGPQPASISVGYNWFGASAGCNGGGATWSSPAPGKLSIGTITATQMRCEQTLMQAEGNLFGALASVTGYRLIGDDRAILEGAREIDLARME